DINRFLTFTHDAIAFYPNDRLAGMLRLYHQPSHQLIRWPKKRRNRTAFHVDCIHCGDVANEDDDTMLPVMPMDFAEYFGLWEKETKTPPVWVKKQLLEWYGRRCFMCSEGINLETLTCDHILPKKLRGKNKASNLQPLCAKCNNERKKDNP